MSRDPLIELGLAVQTTGTISDSKKSLTKIDSIATTLVHFRAQEIKKALIFSLFYHLHAQQVSGMTLPCTPIICILRPPLKEDAL